MTTDEQAATIAEPRTEIDRLRDELHLMKTAGIIEIAVRNPNVSSYMEHWEARATAAERALPDVMAQRDVLRKAAEYALQAIETGRSEPLYIARDYIRNTLEDLPASAARHRAVVEAAKEWREAWYSPTQASPMVRYEAETKLQEAVASLREEV